MYGITAWTRRNHDAGRRLRRSREPFLGSVAACRFWPRAAPSHLSKSSRAPPVSVQQPALTLYCYRQYARRRNGISAYAHYASHELSSALNIHTTHSSIQHDRSRPQEAHAANFGSQLRNCRSVHGISRQTTSSPHVRQQIWHVQLQDVLACDALVASIEAAHLGASAQRRTASPFDYRQEVVRRSQRPWSNYSSRTRRRPQASDSARRFPPKGSR